MSNAQSSSIPGKRYLKRAPDTIQGCCLQYADIEKRISAGPYICTFMHMCMNLLLGFSIHNTSKTYKIEMNNSILRKWLWSHTTAGRGRGRGLGLINFRILIFHLNAFFLFWFLIPKNICTKEWIGFLKALRKLRKKTVEKKTKRKVENDCRCPEKNGREHVFDVCW